MSDKHFIHWGVYSVVTSNLIVAIHLIWLYLLSLRPFHRFLVSVTTDTKINQAKVKTDTYLLVRIYLKFWCSWLCMTFWLYLFHWPGRTSAACNCWSNLGSVYQNQLQLHRYPMVIESNRDTWYTDTIRYNLILSYLILSYLILQGWINSCRLLWCPLAGKVNGRLIILHRCRHIKWIDNIIC